MIYKFLMIWLAKALFDERWLARVNLLRYGVPGKHCTVHFIQQMVPQITDVWSVTKNKLEKAQYPGRP